MAGVVMIFVTARSATGGRTMVAASATLSPGVRSGAALVADAELMIGFGVGTVVGALARIPTSMMLPAGIVPIVQVIVVVPVHVPCVEFADMPVTPGGSTSVSVAAGALAGPRLASVNAYESGVPATTPSGESRFSRTRSATSGGRMLVSCVVALLLRSGSCVAADCAVTGFCRTEGAGWPAGTVKAASISTDWPGRSVSKWHGNAVLQSPELPTNVTPGGSTSLTATLNAAAGPR